MGSSVLTLQLMIVAVLWIEPDHIVDRIVAIDERDGIQDYSRWSISLIGYLRHSWGVQSAPGAVA